MLGIFNTTATPDMTLARQWSAATHGDRNALEAVIKAIDDDFECFNSFSIKDLYENITELVAQADSMNPPLSAACKAQLARAICNVAKRVADAVNAKNSKLGDEYSIETAIDGVTTKQCLDLFVLIPKAASNHDACCRTFTEMAYQFANVTRTHKVPSFIPLLHAYFYMDASRGPICLSFLQSCTVNFISSAEAAENKHQDFSFIAKKVFNAERLPLLLTEMKDLFTADIACFDRAIERESKTLNLAMSLVVWGYKKIMDSSLNAMLKSITTAISALESKQWGTPKQQIEKFDAVLDQVIETKKSLTGKTSDFNDVIDRIYNAGVLFSFNVKQLHPELGLQAGVAPVVNNATPAAAGSATPAVTTAAATAAAINTSSLTPPRGPGM